MGLGGSDTAISHDFFGCGASCDVCAELVCDQRRIGAFYTRKLGINVG